MKDLVRAHILPELDEEASIADQNTQWEAWLHRVALARRKKALAKRRDPKVHELML
jgi:hypothetical protein